MSLSEHRKQRFIIADDDDELLQKIADAVKKTFDARVHKTTNGQQVFKLAEEQNPSMFILDVMMPSLSGWEVCKRLKQNPTTQHIPVLMMTGIGQALNETTSKLYGADATIDKPFELDDFTDKVQSLLLSVQ